MGPPAHHKTIAKHIASTWGTMPRIIEMKAKGTPHVQAIAELADFPEPGFVALATVGLADHGGFELSTAAPAKYSSVMKAIFDVASYVAAGNRTLAPNVTFEKVLAHYYTKNDVAHFLIRNVAPAPLAIPNIREAQWLYAWPVTSDELVWFEGNGKTELEARLDEAGLDAFDLARKSLDDVPSFDPWATKNVTTVRRRTTRTR